MTMSAQHGRSTTVTPLRQRSATKPANATGGDDGSSPPKARAWVRDSERSGCVECGTKFTLFVRRHHCRRCGDIFCNECSSYTWEPYGKRICGYVHTHTCSYLWKVTGSVHARRVSKAVCIPTIPGRNSQVSLCWSFSPARPSPPSAACTHGIHALHCTHARTHVRTHAHQAVLPVNTAAAEGTSRLAGKLRDADPTNPWCHERRRPRRPACDACAKPVTPNTAHIERAGIDGHGDVGRC